MPAGLVFPFDFGYIPGTIGGDGDPVDVLIISDIETFTGCAIDCLIIGGIKASQRERDGERMRNDRMIGIPLVSAQYADVKKLSDLPKGLIDQLESFFGNYNQQTGKVFTPMERLSPERAWSIIQKSRNQEQKHSLVQLFIPLYDQQGKPFPEKFYTAIHTELSEKFGGLTVYTRSSATGIWKENKQKTVHDKLMVYEVLIEDLADRSYWIKLKSKLENQFSQEELLLLISTVQKI